jgi:iron complex outermembrane receptor protein
VLVLAGSATALRAQERARPDSSVLLPPIEVTVARGSAALSRVPFAVATVGNGLAAADLGLSLSAALAAVPGVAIQARGNASRDESVAIRGFGARAAFGVRGVRILMDGIPQTMPDGQSQLTLVNLRRVATIEVLRGTGSALHGNATGGVISLRSDRRVPLRPEGDARVAVGGYGLVSTDAGMRVPLGAGAGDVAVQYDRASGYRAQSRYEVWRAHVGLRSAVGSVGHFGWVADVASYPIAQDPGALTAEEVAADPRQANPRYVEVDAGKDVWQGQTGLTFERAIGAGGRLEAAGFVARRDLINRLPFAHIDLARWAYGGRIEASVPLDGGGRATLVAGGDLQQMRDDRVNRTADAVTVTRDQLETAREIGPFVQLRVAPVERVAVLAGARLDAVTFTVADRLLTDGDASASRTLSAPSGTIGVSVLLAPSLVGWARLGTAFETPTTTELANRPDGSGGFNADLEPQQAVEVELGARVTTGVLHAGAAVFHADVRDELVAFEVPSDPGRAYFRNAGRARHRGVELDARYQARVGPWLAATYTLSDHRFVEYATDAARFDGNRIPGVPMHFGRLAAGIRLGPARLEAEIRGASRVFADDGNTATAEAWWAADLKAAADLRLGAWVLGPIAGVENVFDRRYVAAVSVNAAAGRFYEPAPGRTAYIGLSVRPAPFPRVDVPDGPGIRP